MHCRCWVRSNAASKVAQKLFSDHAHLDHNSDPEIHLGQTTPHLKLR